MKYFVEMKITKSGPRIEEMQERAKKKSLSKYEIRSKGDKFFTDDLRIAIAVRGAIRGTSRRLEAQIYQKIFGKYLPLFTHITRTDQDIEVILSTENKEELCRSTE